MQNDGAIVYKEVQNEVVVIADRNALHKVRAEWEIAAQFSHFCLLERPALYTPCRKVVNDWRKK